MSERVEEIRRRLKSGSTEGALEEALIALAQAEAEVARLKDTYSRMNAEIEQTLAQAIGCYPWYKDDQKNFPGATEKDGVCVGDHVAESLALEAANIITTQKAALAQAQADLAQAEREIEDWAAIRLVRHGSMEGRGEKS